MMNQGDLLKKTGNILKELQEQYDYLVRDPEKLSELELELFLANAHFLNEHIQILKKIGNSSPIKELPQQTAVNPKEVKDKRPVEIFEDLFKPDVESTPTFEFLVGDKNNQHTDADLAAPVTEPESTDSFTDQQPTPEAAEKNAETNPPAEVINSLLNTDVHEEPYIAAEPVQMPPSGHDYHFSDGLDLPEEKVSGASEEDEDGPEPFLVPKDHKYQPTLNEMLAGKSSGSSNEQTFAQDSGRPAISDLKSAINLNEKLLFIKDLFDGYNLAYAEAIDLVNKMPDFNTADKFLQSNYAVKHKWSAKQETADQFYELLRQRFPK